MSDLGIRVLRLINGNASPIDGMWLVEYDPTRPGVSPTGRPMLAHIVCSDDPRDAVTFTSVEDAKAMYLAPSGRTRPDGEPDRPLSAFNVLIEELS